MNKHFSKGIEAIKVRNAVNGNTLRTYFLFDCTCGYHVSSDDRTEVVREINKHCAAPAAQKVTAAADLYEHYPNCPTTSGVAFDGECCCYETKLEVSK
jgi:hypothetical protein